MSMCTGIIAIGTGERTRVRPRVCVSDKGRTELSVYGYISIAIQYWPLKKLLYQLTDIILYTDQ